MTAVNGMEAKISALNVLDFGPKTEVAPGAAARFGIAIWSLAPRQESFHVRGRNLSVSHKRRHPRGPGRQERAGEFCEFRGRKLKVTEVY